MTVPRTKGLCTKVTEDEYARFERLAGGETLSDWRLYLMIVREGRECSGFRYVYDQFRIACVNGSSLSECLCEAEGNANYRKSSGCPFFLSGSISSSTYRLYCFRPKKQGPRRGLRLFGQVASLAD